MANHAKMQMEEYRSFVRKILVAKPRASLMEIQRQLIANNLPKLHVDTITKIRNKCISERVHKMNRFFLTMRLGEQLDSRAEILSHAWAILLKPEDNNQKMSAMRLILEEEHNWTKLLILVGILDRGDKRAEALLGVKEKEFPAETFDTILEAINVNQLSPRIGAFKYLPDTPIEPKSKQILDAKPTVPIIADDRSSWPTTIPLKNDRSLAVSAKNA